MARRLVPNLLQSSRVPCPPRIGPDCSGVPTLYPEVAGTDVSSLATSPLPQRISARDADPATLASFISLFALCRILGSVRSLRQQWWTTNTIAIRCFPIRPFTSSHLQGYGIDLRQSDLESFWRGAAVARPQWLLASRYVLRSSTKEIELHPSPGHARSFPPRTCVLHGNSSDPNQCVA